MSVTLFHDGVRDIPMVRKKTLSATGVGAQH